jgi:hypothetical protein
VTNRFPRPPVPDAATAIPSGRTHPGVLPVGPGPDPQPTVSPHQIVNIIDMIDEIALQTRTLAQTTAAEAARAGRQDRDFSLVAAEAKNLAQRSTAAVQEIRGMMLEAAHKTRLADQDRDRELAERAKRWRRSLLA